jgi:hypothetical protein
VSLASRAVVPSPTIAHDLGGLPDVELLTPNTDAMPVSLLNGRMGGWTRADG